MNDRSFILLHRFISEQDLLEPVDDGTDNQVSSPLILFLTYNVYNKSWLKNSPWISLDAEVSYVFCRVEIKCLWNWHSVFPYLFRYLMACLSKGDFMLFDVFSILSAAWLALQNAFSLAAVHFHLVWCEQPFWNHLHRCVGPVQEIYGSTIWLLSCKVSSRADWRMSRHLC